MHYFTEDIGNLDLGPEKSQKDPGEIPEGYRKDPGRIPEGSRKDPGWIPEGSRKDPGRIPDGSRKDPGRLPEGFRKDPGEIPEISMKVTPRVIKILPFNFDCSMCSIRLSISTDMSHDLSLMYPKKLCGCALVK